MRPVNLIPLEERRGEKAPLRTGPLAYVVVAVLGLALLGVTLVVLTNNQISDREAQKESIEGQVQQTQAQAKELAPFVSFAALQEARQQTVTSLAESRFDWERTLRELAIVIPSDVWLTDLSATAAGASSSSSSTAGSAIEGPSLDISGCATGQEAVAGFLAALRDVDGVTRATVMSSERGGSGGSTSSTSTSTSSSGAGCAVRDFITTFEVTVAFDGAQPGSTTDSSSSVASPSTAQDTSPTGSGSSASSTEQAQASGGQGEDGGTVVAGTGSTP